MKSMTGYGRSRFSDEVHEIEVEIKSVNSRFLDLKYRLPRELSFLESKLDGILNKKIKRGKIQVNINVKNKKGAALELNEDNLKTYWELYSKAADILGLENDGTLSKILTEPDVIVQQEDNPEDPEFQKNLLLTFESALVEHQNMASTEGESMRSYLLEATEMMKKSINKLAAEFPAHKVEIHEKIKGNIEKLLQSKLDDEALKRIMLESAIYVEKADVTEEIVRLNDHIVKFQTRVKQNDSEAGKSINFILQEMHREINTIGSKFNSTKIFDEILNVKEEIEKCREIIQNVE
jgi:uncharacterized protein (TIGR00255 family)